MLPWIAADEPLPSAKTALDEASGYSGLVCAGLDLSKERLLEAYSQGMFPWSSEGQPVLWWSPSPRMVLKLENFRLHRSLQKVMRRKLDDGGYGLEGGWQIRVNTAFQNVMRACAEPRNGQDGTWITEAIVSAYSGLHSVGKAHSVEVWQIGTKDEHGQATEHLIGGLYGVCLGKMFYGESMFARQADSSKTALAWLVNFLSNHGVPMIDCQQNTKHLSFMGAKEIHRTEFLSSIATLIEQESIVFPQGIQA
jgi:leucyl/phenylalanyl-tRNA---protein transferase